MMSKELTDEELICEECFGKGFVFCEHNVRATCGLCRDCKWWEVRAQDGTWGECQRVREDGQKMSVDARDPYGITFDTDWDFGCTEWEAKA